MSGAPARTPVTRPRERGPRAWPFYAPETATKVAQLVGDGSVLSIGQHPAVAAFEERFARRHGSAQRALFCGSGSSALLAAYFGLDLDPGAEVLVPTNTYPTTVTPLLLLNLRPVLCDCDPLTGNISLDDAARRVTSKTQAIAVTHLWGHPVDMDEVSPLASRHGLAVVEDCSHAHGATCRNEPVGTRATVAAFSVGSRKLVSGGMGGVLLTADESVYARALVLGHHPDRARDHAGAALGRYVDAGFGLNLRGTAIAAVLAADHLERLDATIDIKNRNLELLARALEQHAPWLTPPRRRPWFTSGTWYGFRCAVDLPPDHAPAALQLLRDSDVAMSTRSVLLHRQRLFSDPSPLRTHVPQPPALCDPDDYPMADAAVGRSVAIETLQLYEPAEELIEGWAIAFQRVTEALGRSSPDG